MIKTALANILTAICFATISGNPVSISLVTNKGPIVGLRYDPNPSSGVSYDAFLGIPYGTVRARFQLAESPSNWTEPLYAQVDGPVCPQANSVFSEDCLHLNVFTPMNASSDGSLAVMVFLHGAGFTQGSSTSSSFGPDFLVNKTVVLVTLNYRLGAAGFLTLGSKVAPGNLGLHDTLLALQWVQEEISVFGGDPTQVTLFGQSSGSVMVQMHYLSPLSTDLFHRAIAESGSALCDWGHYSSVSEGVRRAKVLAQAVGCDTAQNDSVLLTCLQQANITDIVNNQFIDGIITENDKISGNYRVFLPVIDSDLIAEKPFFNDSLDNLMAVAVTISKPMLTGVTTDEGVLKFVYNFWKKAESSLEAFIPYKAQSVLEGEEITAAATSIKNHYFSDSLTLNKVQSLVQLYTDYNFAYPSVQMSRYFANVTYGYLFAYAGSWSPTPSYFTEYRLITVAHGAEIAYLFYSTSRDISTCSTNWPNVNIKNQFVNWWTNFAKTGVPDGGSWPTVAEGGYLVINSSLSTMTSSAFEDRYYSFWANLSSAQSSTKSSGRTIPQGSLSAVLALFLLLVTNELTNIIA